MPHCCHTGKIVEMMKWKLNQKRNDVVATTSANRLAGIKETRDMIKQSAPQNIHEVKGINFHPDEGKSHFRPSEPNENCHGGYARMFRRPAAETPRRHQQTTEGRITALNDLLMSSSHSWSSQAYLNRGCFHFDLAPGYCFVRSRARIATVKFLARVYIDWKVRSVPLWIR